MQFVTRIVRKLHAGVNILKLLDEFSRCLRRCQVDVAFEFVLNCKNKTGVCRDAR